MFLVKGSLKDDYDHNNIYFMTSFNIISTYLLRGVDKNCNISPYIQNPLDLQ